ncbi:MAG TPA: aconitate hydratase, partial [Waddliaceae bacterium]
KAVVVRSFERIHRSNLIGMGVLPLQFQNEHNEEDFELTGEELFSIIGEAGPQKQLVLEISRDNQKQQIPLLCRIDTPSEMDYYRHGGILPFVLRQKVVNC